MKKIFSMAMALMLICSICCITVFAAEGTSAAVYVTISDETGKLVLTQAYTKVTDIDGDGALTVNDALYAAHEKNYDGGATAGYYSYAGQYELSLGKLWGNESGSFGYRVNNASAWSLVDPVKDGDYVSAYIYQDQTTWSDAYTWFDVNAASSAKGGEVTLTLSKSAYDANYNPLTLPVEGATITVNGVATAYKTDAEGKVTVKLEIAGQNIISATSDAETLVPPVCAVNVAEAASSPVVLIVCIVLAVLVVAGAAVVIMKKKK